MQAICKCCERINKRSNNVAPDNLTFLNKLSNGTHEAAVSTHLGVYVVRLFCEGLRVADIAVQSEGEAIRVAEEHTLFI